MSFGAGMGAGIGVGIGAGIAMGHTQGRKAAADELRQHIEEHELSVFDRSGQRVDVNDLVAVVGEKGCSRCAGGKAVAVIVALLAGVAAMGGVLYLAMAV